MPPALDRQVSRPMESGLSSALRPRPVTGVSLQEINQKSSSLVKYASAHRAGDDTLGLTGLGVARIGLSELADARRLNKMAAVADAVDRKRRDNRPALHTQTLVIEHELGIVDGLRLLDAIGLALFKFCLNGGDTLIDFGRELINSALLLIVTGLSIGDALFGGRQIVHSRELIAFGGIRIVVYKINLNGILLIFLVGLKACLSLLKLTNLFLKLYGFFFIAFNATLSVLEPFLGCRKIGTYTRKSGGLEGFAAGEIFKFNFKLTDSSVNFLQIKQRFYNRHLMGPFRSGAGDGTRTRNPQNHNLMI